MSSVTSSTLVHQIAARHEIETDLLTSSAAQAEAFLRELRSLLHEQFPPDTLPGVDIVVVGSIAKGQCTVGSDIDYFGICEEPLEPSVVQPIVQAILEKARASGFDAPFAQGSNGVFVRRSEIETLNLVADDNRSVFRRMTLVTGSVSVYRPELRADIVRTVLSGFIGSPREPRARGIIDQILLLSRLGNMTCEWRRKDRLSDGGLVQWAKNFTLYRVDRAASIVGVIQASLASEGRSREDLVDSVARHLERPPLDRFLACYDDVSAAGQAALAAIVAVTNESLTLFGTDGVRPRLVADADDAAGRELRQRFQDLMRRLNDAIVQLFFKEPLFRGWTEELGVFG